MPNPTIAALTPGASSGCSVSMRQLYSDSVLRTQNIFAVAENQEMSPIERIDAELSRRKLKWASLMLALGVTKQSVSNWRRDGLPAKHYSKIDEFFGMPYGWVELGVEPAMTSKTMLENSPARLQSVLVTVGAMFRMIPENEWADALLDVSTTLQKRNHFR